MLACVFQRIMGYNAMSVLCATFAAFGFSIFFNLHGKKLWTAAIGGGVGWLFFLLFQSSGDLMQYFAASAATALYSESMARIQKAPVTVYLVPALIPLVPGGAIYQAMLHALNGDSELFISTGIHALTITGALTLGIVAVSSLIRLFAVHKLPNHSS